MAAATDSAKARFEFFNPDAGMFSGLTGPMFEKILLHGRDDSRVWIVYRVELE